MVNEDIKERFLSLTEAVKMGLIKKEELAEEFVKSMKQSPKSFTSDFLFPDTWREPKRSKSDWVITFELDPDLIFSKENKTTDNFVPKEEETW